MADTTIHQAGDNLTEQEREARQRVLHETLFRAAFDWLKDAHGFDPVVIGQESDGTDIMAVTNMTPEVNGDMVIVFANVMGTLIGGAAPEFIESMFSQAIDATREAVEAHPQFDQPSQLN